MSTQEEKATTTLKELCEQRFYKLKSHDENTNSSIYISPTNTQIKIYFSPFPKFNTEAQKEILSNTTEEIKHFIIVYKEITAIAKTGQNISQLGFIIELFSIKELQYNPTKHRLVPKHTLVDKEKIPQNFNVKCFPILLKTDPIARFYGFQKDDIVSIHRFDQTIIYRIVR